MPFADRYRRQEENIAHLPYGAKQGHRLLVLAGGRGVGKSRLVQHICQGDTPVTYAPWHATHRLTLNQRERLLFRRLEPRQLRELRRLHNIVIYECSTGTGTYALLAPDVVEATQRTVGLVIAPTLGAKRLLDVGFDCYIVRVTATGKYQPPSAHPDLDDADPRVIGLRVDEYLNNDFGPGGLERSRRHLMNLAQSLKNS